LFKNKGIQLKHHQRYGKELGQRLYDFYIPKTNTYIEVTGYNNRNFLIATGHHWISYLRNIVKKRQFVKKIGAKFQFIQSKKLKLSQIKYVKEQI